MDASSKTPGGFSLNDLLPKGQPNIVNLLSMTLSWRMGRSAFTGDISQFYNAVLLSSEFWQYQKILLKENLDINSATEIAIILTLIYGVTSVSGQSEEVVKLLANYIEDKYPEIYKLLIDERYVDDFGKSTMSDETSDNLIKKATEVLGMVGMKVKGWTVSGRDPPEKVSEDGQSVGFAGKTWFPKADIFKLHIQSLHFSKKKRGAYPKGLVKFDEAKMSFEEYTPKNLNRRQCTGVVSRIYDPEGLLTPITLKCKNDLRQLIKFEPSKIEQIFLVLYYILRV